MKVLQTEDYDLVYISGTGSASTLEMTDEEKNKIEEKEKLKFGFRVDGK